MHNITQKYQVIFVQSYKISNFFKKTAIFYEGNAKFLGYILEAQTSEWQTGCLYTHTSAAWQTKSAVSPPCFIGVQRKDFYVKHNFGEYSLQPNVQELSGGCRNS